MRTLKYLLIKEFKQIFRNKAILGIIMVMPIIQLLILPHAANYEVKNIKLVVVDNDHSVYSRKLISDITSSGYFQLTANSQSFKLAFKEIEADNADLVLEIPPNFEKDMIREQSQSLFIAVNAINGTKANLGASYLSRIIREYNNKLRAELLPVRKPSASGTIEITSANWFNPRLDYKSYMVPGILAILVTMVGGFLAALNIVKEKEVGTIEQINVTPIRKSQFILGKLIPFWILGNVVFTIGLILSWLIYGIIPQGSLLVIYIFIAIYLVAILGFGLLVSTYAETQQQAMFIMFFFMMMFILLSGLFTSIDSMPVWAKVLAYLNPVTYIIDVFRMVILKSSGLRDVLPHIGVIAVAAIILNTWAVKNYRKTT